MRSHLDPDVQALLEVVLRDNESAFRRIASLTTRKAYEAPLSATQPFLTKEERYLLDRHREEVGRLFYEGCMLTLQGPIENTKTIVTFNRVDGTRWSHRKERLERKLASVPVEGITMIRGSGPGGRFGTREARLAVALFPSEGSRFALALLSRLEGDLRSAESVAREMVEASLDPGWVAAAHTILGLAAHQQQDHGRALTEYRHSWEVDSRVAAGSMNWFVQAVLLGDIDEALAASERIQEERERHLPVFDSYLSVLRSDPVLLRTTRSAKVEPLLRGKIRGDLETRILDALQSYRKL